MRKLREVLRLKWSERRRHRQIARAFGVKVGTVSDVVRAAPGRRPAADDRLLATDER